MVAIKCQYEWVTLTRNPRGVEISKSKSFSGIIIHCCSGLDSNDLHSAKLLEHHHLSGVDIRL